MGWKLDLSGSINVAISRRQNTIIAVHSAEQELWGKQRLDNIFSKLYLLKYIKISFKIIPLAEQDRVSTGTMFKGNDKMEGINARSDSMEIKDNTEGKRVIHEEHGTGVITLCTYIGPKPIFYVKFDGLTDEIILDGDDPKLRFEEGNKSIGEEDEVIRKLNRENELKLIQTEALVEANELQDMDNETLLIEFEGILRGGAGHGYRRLVFAKKEILRRMDKGNGNVSRKTV